VITKEMISNCLIGVQCRCSDDFRDLSVNESQSWQRWRKRKNETEKKRRQILFNIS